MVFIENKEGIAWNKQLRGRQRLALHSFWGTDPNWAYAGVLYLDIIISTILRR